MDAVHLPPVGSNVRNQSVLQRPCRIGTAYENVEYQGNIPGKPSHFIGKFQLVSVKNISIEVIRQFYAS